MGTVYGSIYFPYDWQSDDTLNDDAMELLRHASVKEAVEDPSNKEDDSFWTEFAR